MASVRGADAASPRGPCGRWPRGAAPETQLTVPAGGDTTVLAGREDLRRLRFRDTWSVSRRSSRGQRLIRQARWQTWSAAPA